MSVLGSVTIQYWEPSVNCWPYPGSTKSDRTYPFHSSSPSCILRARCTIKQKTQRFAAVLTRFLSRRKADGRRGGGGDADGLEVCWCGPTDSWNKDMVTNHTCGDPLLGVVRRTYTSKGVLRSHSGCRAARYVGYWQERKCVSYITGIYTNSKWALGDSVLLLHETLLQTNPMLQSQSGPHQKQPMYLRFICLITFTNVSLFCIYEYI
jgi:hypothetical protein